MSATGAHSIGETPCRGVQKGSAESVVLVGDSLFYKSRADICVWQGGFPESVSEALGAEQYTDAAAGALGGKYYISMKNSAGEWGLYVYDSLLGIWLREDSLHRFRRPPHRPHRQHRNAGNGRELERRERNNVLFAAGA